MASTTTGARDGADDPVLAQSTGFTMRTALSVGHLVALVLGLVVVVAAVARFGAIGDWAAGDGEEAAEWLVPGGLTVLAGYAVIYGALGVRRSLRRWFDPSGAALTRQRYRVSGGREDAEALWEAISPGAPGGLPRLREGRTGPIVVSTYVDARRTCVHVTIALHQESAPRLWPIVTRNDAAAVRWGQGSGADEAANPIST